MHEESVRVQGFFDAATMKAAASAEPVDGTAAEDVDVVDADELTQANEKLSAEM